MKKAILAVLLVLFFTSVSLAIEILPERSKGISMHMLPKQVADLDGQKWGFVVSYAEYLKPERGKPILQNTQEFLVYVRKQDKKVQENGVSLGNDTNMMESAEIIKNLREKAGIQE